jgi:ankyrin repeat protein
MVVKVLLDRTDIEVNARDDEQRTPLQRTAENGHESVVKLLLDHDAFADARDQYGLTAIASAAMSGNAHVVKLLLDRPDVNAVLVHT